jgi:hypothetical protein
MFKEIRKHSSEQLFSAVLKLKSSEIMQQAELGKVTLKVTAKKYEAMNLFK